MFNVHKAYNVFRASFRSVQPVSQRNALPANQHSVFYVSRSALLVSQHNVFYVSRSVFLANQHSVCCVSPPLITFKVLNYVPEVTQHTNVTPVPPVQSIAVC
ncbi:hypothetical protein [Pseudoalteromonas piscicida]|uniref:Uncharacterized protein n=1 Tax=Pseudoalteromonas piscicida TaxID=43662 RepID=A0A2A5JJX9_PSEO7|nr:hypothetical protein [Pseudoalteromonas piscicida]PCK29733.1 hypothetical protein CEX98_21425 [Pseudoalteromonas piscicida]